MAGIPPLAGFFAKLNILITLIKSSFYVITGIALLISVISTYYYAQIVRYMFFEKDNYSVCYLYDSNNKYLTLIIMIFVSFNMFFFCIMDSLALLAFSLSQNSVYIFI